MNKIDSDLGRVEKDLLAEAEKQIQEKLRANGLSEVRVKVIKKGKEWLCEFTGSEEEIEQAETLVEKL